MWQSVRNHFEGLPRRLQVMMCLSVGLAFGLFLFVVRISNAVSYMFDGPKTCMNCMGTDVPRLMNTMGVEAFYAANFHDLKKEVTHPIGCQDCYDPKTMKLRIPRPALKEAFTAMGKGINQANETVRLLP